MKDQLKRYTITIPFAGYFRHQIDAFDEEQALKELHDLIAEQRIVSDKRGQDIDEVEWDVYEKLSQGNVNYVHVNKQTIEVEDIEEEQE